MIKVTVCSKLTVTKHTYK